MDLTEVVIQTFLQYSIDTKEYGKLYFMIFPNPDKENEINKIRQKNPDDNAFTKNTFETLYLRGTKNEKKLEELDFSKITDAEFLEFKNLFFSRQFCDYKYNPEISWEKNIFEGNKFQDKRMIDVGRNLSEKLNINLKGIPDDPTKHAMLHLRDTLDKINKSRILTSESLSNNPYVELPVQRNYVLETENKILNESKLIKENISDLTQLIENLISLTNCMKSKQEEQLNITIENAKNQALDSKKEIKNSSRLSYVAIGISVLALLFDIGINLYNLFSSKKKDIIMMEYENQKIELLQTLNSNNEFLNKFDKIENNIFQLEEKVSYLRDVNEDVKKIVNIINEKIYFGRIQNQNVMNKK